MADQVRIQVLFSKFHEEKRIEFTDALYFTEEEYANLKPSELEDLKDTRFNSWKNMVDNPPEPVEPTKEQLQEEADMLQRQLDEIKAEIAEKENEVIDVFERM